MEQKPIRLTTGPFPIKSNKETKVKQIITKTSDFILSVFFVADGKG
jgi:hypothetical protein